STIAFPNNPYHRLVKGYKLLSDSRNDPLKDARLTLDLFGEEIEALGEMHRSDPGWVALLHFLLRLDSPFNRLLTDVRGSVAPGPTEAAGEAMRRFGGICCSTRLAQFP